MFTFTREKSIKKVNSFLTLVLITWNVIEPSSMQHLQFVILFTVYFYFSLQWGRISVWIWSGLNQKKPVWRSTMKKKGNQSSSFIATTPTALPVSRFVIYLESNLHKFASFYSFIIRCRLWLNLQLRNSPALSAKEFAIWLSRRQIILSQMSKHWTLSIWKILKTISSVTVLFYYFSYIF